jgi:hypothetical protein
VIKEKRPASTSKAGQENKPKQMSGNFGINSGIWLRKERKSTVVNGRSEPLYISDDDSTEEKKTKRLTRLIRAQAQKNEDELLREVLERSKLDTKPVATSSANTGPADLTTHREQPPQRSKNKRSLDTSPPRRKGIAYPIKRPKVSHPPRLKMSQIFTVADFAPTALKPHRRPRKKKVDRTSSASQPASSAPVSTSHRNSKSPLRSSESHGVQPAAQSVEAEHDLPVAAKSTPRKVTSEIWA